MEKQHQKWVNLSYLLIAIFAYYVFFVSTQRIAAAYDLEVTIRNIDLIVRILSFVVGGICFGVLYRNAKINTFMNEVVQELSRVTWPGQKETTNATVVVIIMVMISGMILGFLDYLWTKLLQLVV